MNLYFKTSKENEIDYSKLTKEELIELIKIREDFEQFQKEHHHKYHNNRNHHHKH